MHCEFRSKFSNRPRNVAQARCSRANHPYRRRCPTMVKLAKLAFRLTVSTTRLVPTCMFGRWVARYGLDSPGQSFVWHCLFTGEHCLDQRALSAGLALNAVLGVADPNADGCRDCNNVYRLGHYGSTGRPRDMARLSGRFSKACRIGKGAVWTVLWPNVA